MRSWTPGARCAVVFLGISAILFAPANYEDPSGPNRGPEAPIEARVLAPTVGEGLVAPTKLTISHLQTGEDRAPRSPVAIAVAAVAAAVLLAGAWSAAGFPSRGNSPRLIFFRLKVPRGPPGLQAV